MFKVSSPTRIDFFGGTLDIEPINLILQDVWTINVGTDLCSKVKLVPREDHLITIHSVQYDKCTELDLNELTWNNFYFDRAWSEKRFQQLTFTLSIAASFAPDSGFDLYLDSDIPAGSGMGGSSSMGVSVYKAFAAWKKYEFNWKACLNLVKSMEARILNQGMPGYQDYFPPMLGGVLAIRKTSEFEYIQFDDQKLSDYLESHCRLVFSGKSRDSGPNNWTIYKEFFDGNQQIRGFMAVLATLSKRAKDSLTNRDYDAFSRLLNEEAKTRREFFPDLLDDKTRRFQKDLEQLTDGNLELKVCGAGGGGCFLVLGRGYDQVVQELIAKYQMQPLTWKVQQNRGVLG